MNHFVFVYRTQIRSDLKNNTSNCVNVQRQQIQQVNMFLIVGVWHTLTHTYSIKLTMKLDLILD